MTVPITPETKVGALLDAYPDLEETLVACAPAFAKLKNPILRKTVAKVATLEQAASVGGIALRELLVKLRQAAGQDAGDGRGEVSGAAPVAPAWIHDGPIAQEIDVDRMLDAGSHPLGAVRQWLREAQPEEVLRLRSRFRPQPLIDELTRAGVAVYSAETAPGCHETLVRKTPA